MYIALVEVTQKHDNGIAIKVFEETFTCSAHSQSELISLIHQYRIAQNKRHGIDVFYITTYRLKSVSDLGVNTPLSTLRHLGVIELDKATIAKLKSEALALKPAPPKPKD